MYYLQFTVVEDIKDLPDNPKDADWRQFMEFETRSEAQSYAIRLREMLTHDKEVLTVAVIEEAYLGAIFTDGDVVVFRVAAPNKLH